MGTPTTVTDQSGSFRLQNLAPGDYKLTFELTGFGTVTRENIRVSLGFTATVNITMSPAAVAETVNVSSASPIVDLQNTNVTSHYDAQVLASLPGSRDYWAVVAQTPAVSMSRMDVGGSGALTQQPYTSYGLTSAGGVNRGMIEGMVVNEGGGGGGSDLYYTDYGSFAEIAVNAVGNTAEMPNPGVLSQFISKSGGNAYHGDAYFDYENDSIEARNIDAGQIARGVTGSNIVAAADTNRLATLKDFDADLGGYVVKDKLWWYGAFRYTVADQRYPTLLDDVQHTWSPVLTGKVTYNANDRHKVIGYYQHSNKKQPDYLGAIFIGGGRQTTALMTRDSVWSSVYPVDVWKVEYNGVLSKSLFVQVLGGNYRSIWARTGKSTAPRIEDVGNNQVSGGVYGTSFDRGRPQARGSISYVRTTGVGTHNLKFGAETMDETLTNPFDGLPSACNCVSVLNNGRPTQVRLYTGSNTSQTGVWNQAAYANDSWQNGRLTVNVGIRFDRFRAYMPAQTGADQTVFAANDSAVVWNNWGPRVGGIVDLLGNGKTVLKANYGRYWLSPSADFVGTISANPSGWYRQYAWSDPNGDGVWEPGEQGALQSVNGGSNSTIFDPNLQNQFTHQVTTYIERELAANFGVRSGFVWNGLRNYYGQVNVNRPLDAYNVAASIADPGPDGRIGTADDGGALTAYNLNAQALAVKPVNAVTQLKQADSDYYTWELTATKRESGRWSLQASFANTWNRERPSSFTGTSYTPNAQINTVDGRNNSTTWQAKTNATLLLDWGLRITPVFRYQSGSPYGRTFVSSLNYGTATILAEPVGAERTPNIALLDIRTEKTLAVRGLHVAGFFDVYNIFNSNAEQAISTSSGSSYLRPTAITPPRIARVGVKLQW